MIDWTTHERQGPANGDGGAGQTTAVYPLGSEFGVVSEGVIRSYRDLRVWQGGMALVEAVYRLSASFPAEERFGLTSQIRRATVSVPSNIAEGWGRASRGDYLRFLRYAQGSLREAETHWLIAERLGFLDPPSAESLEQQGALIGRQLISLTRALQ